MTKPANARKRLRQLRQMQQTLIVKAAIRADANLPRKSLESRVTVVSWALTELLEKYNVKLEEVDKDIERFA